ncbi:unnamed protein product, partial [Polarella glacialis]
VNDMFDFDDLPEACQEDAAREGSDLVAKPSRRSSRGAFSALVSSGSNASNDRSSNALRQRCEDHGIASEDHGIASEVIGAVAAADVLREVERLQLLREDELAAECQAQGLGCAPGSLPREELEWRLKQLRIWKVMPLTTLQEKCRERASHVVAATPPRDGQALSHEELVEAMVVATWGGATRGQQVSKSCKEKGVPLDRLESLERAEQLLAEFNRLE